MNIGKEKHRKCKHFIYFQVIKKDAEQHKLCKRLPHLQSCASSESRYSAASCVGLAARNLLAVGHPDALDITWILSYQTTYSTYIHIFHKTVSMEFDYKTSATAAYLITKDWGLFLTYMNIQENCGLSNDNAINKILSKRSSGLCSHYKDLTE